MAYSADRKPGELTALTSLATDDIFVVGDTSDTSEVAKGITKANLITDLTTSFATAAHNHTGVYAPVLGADDNYVTDAEKAALHAAVTVTDSSDINFTLTGQDITANIIDGSVTLAKQANMATASVVYRKTAGSGAPEVNTLATLKTDLALVTQTITNGVTTSAPSEDVVFDALALKAPLASPTFTGTVTSPAVVLSSETASTLASFDASKNIKSLAVASYPSLTEIAYVKGVTSAIQTQLNAKLDSSAYDDATAAETNTGTSTAKYVSPDSLAGSNLGIRYATVTLNGTTALTTSEKAYFRIPAALTGMNLVSVTGTVGTGAAGSSSSGTPTFTVKNVTDANQMLSTSLTIDASEYTSATAAVAAVINASFDDVVTDDLIEVAVTTSGTGVTYATITLGFQLP